MGLEGALTSTSDEPTILRIVACDDPIQTIVVPELKLKPEPRTRTVLPPLTGPEVGLIDVMDWADDLLAATRKTDTSASAKRLSDHRVRPLRIRAKGMFCIGLLSNDWVGQLTASTDATPRQLP
jgi:hypothetical protein